MDSSDPLNEFLKNTGWSCDELLQKLLQIKSKATTSQETKDEPTKQKNLAENVSNSQTASTSKPETTSTSTHSNLADKDFSDTDEEEEEVISTNKHIIDEIIEDIADDNSAEQKEAAITKDCEPVIELDSDEEDEDDNFEEECCPSGKKTSTETDNAKAKNSDAAAKSKSGSDSAIVIVDDEEKTVVRRNDSNGLNDVVASVSLIRTDSTDKNSTDDDLEVIGIEDVYDSTDLQKQGPIHVVSLGVPEKAGSFNTTEFSNKNDLSLGSTCSKKSPTEIGKAFVTNIIRPEVSSKSSTKTCVKEDERAWLLPTILSVEGASDSEIKLDTSKAGRFDATGFSNKNDLSQVSTCSKKSPTEIGKAFVTNIIQPEVSTKSSTKPCVKKDEEAWLLPTILSVEGASDSEIKLDTSKAGRFDATEFSNKNDLSQVSTCSKKSPTEIGKAFITNIIQPVVSTKSSTKTCVKKDEEAWLLPTILSVEGASDSEIKLNTSKAGSFDATEFSNKNDLSQVSTCSKKSPTEIGKAFATNIIQPEVSTKSSTKTRVKEDEKAWLLPTILSVEGASDSEIKLDTSKAGRFDATNKNDLSQASTCSKKSPTEIGNASVTDITQPEVSSEDDRQSTTRTCLNKDETLASKGSTTFGKQPSIQSTKIPSYSCNIQDTQSKHKPSETDNPPERVNAQYADVYEAFILKIRNEIEAKKLMEKTKQEKHSELPVSKDYTAENTLSVQKTKQEKHFDLPVSKNYTAENKLSAQKTKQEKHFDLSVSKNYTAENKLSVQKTKQGKHFDLPVSKNYTAENKLSVQKTKQEKHFDLPVSTNYTAENKLSVQKTKQGKHFDLPVSKNYTAVNKQCLTTSNWTLTKPSNKKPSPRSVLLPRVAEKPNPAPMVFTAIAIGTAVETYPTKEWQLPKIVSVEGAVEVDKTETDAEVGLNKKPNEALFCSSTEEAFLNTTTVAASVGRKEVAKPLELPKQSSVTSILTAVSERIENQDNEPKILTDSLTMDKSSASSTVSVSAALSEESEDQNKDHVTEEPITLPPKGITDSLTMDSTADYVKSALKSSRDHNLEVNVTEESSQNKPKSVGDSTSCCLDSRTRELSVVLVDCLQLGNTESESLKKDVNQNQEFKFSSTARRLDEAVDDSASNVSPSSKYSKSGGILDVITEPGSSDKQDITDLSGERGSEIDKDSSKLPEGKLVSSTTTKESFRDFLLNALEGRIVDLNDSEKPIIQTQKSQDDLVQPKKPIESLLVTDQCPIVSHVNIMAQSQSETFKDAPELSKGQTDCLEASTKQETESPPKSLEESSTIASASLNVAKESPKSSTAEDLDTTRTSTEPETPKKPLELLNTSLDTVNDDIANNKQKLSTKLISPGLEVTAKAKLGTKDELSPLEKQGSSTKVVSANEDKLSSTEKVMKSQEKISAVVESPAKDGLKKKAKLSTVDELWMQIVSEDEDEEEEEEEEEVEYRLVDPHVVDNPNSPGAGVEDIADTMSSSSTEDYAVEALENTTSPEDTDLLTAEIQKSRRVEQLRDEIKRDLSTLNNAIQPRLIGREVEENKPFLIRKNIYQKGLRNENTNTDDRKECLLLRTFRFPAKNVDQKALRIENTNTDEKKESKLIRTFDLHVKNVDQKDESSMRYNPSEQAEGIEKYPSTASVSGAQPKKSSRQSMADILCTRFLDEASAKDTDDIESSDTILDYKKTTTGDMVRARLKEAGFIHSDDEEEDDLVVKSKSTPECGNVKESNDVVKDKPRLLNSEEELVTEEDSSSLLKEVANDVTPNADNLVPESSDNNLQKNYIRVETQEPKPSTSTCQEDVVFAVPKLPPLRASSSKHHETEMGNVEDIRMNLKLQLSSLRNRKRQHVQITTKINDSFFSEATSNQSEKKAMVKELTGPETVPQLQDELYTQTNELGLVILDVQGGVEMVDEVNTVAEKLTEEIAKDSKEDGEDLVRQQTEEIAEDSEKDGEKSEVEDLMKQQTEEIAKDGEKSEVEDLARQKTEETTKNSKEGEVEDLVRQIIGKKGEPKIRIRTDLTIRPPQIDDFEIFQKRFGDIIDGAICKSLADPGPSTSAAKTHDKDMSIPESDLLYGENSQISSGSNEKSLSAGEEKSPFVSNTLDEFLTGNAQLNVSYNIPKCGAEEGLREVHFESEPAELVLKKVADPKQDDVGAAMKKVGKKVRTLAQKRKLLEKQMAKEKRQKEREQQKEKIEKAKQEEQKKLEDKNKDRSYVIESGKKIWVNSFLPNRCIVNIDEAKTTQPKKSLPESPRQKKISLLENLHKKHQVKYSPGPLSKKHVLQVGGTTDWKTEVKPLPQVMVEVVPQLGHPFPPELMGRISFDPVLTADHIEFALTALKTKNPPLEPARKFVLPVSYSKNQRQIMVRKKVPPPEPLQVETVESDAQKAASQDSSDDRTVISKVVDDLINYVEIKELAPSLIKDDDYDFTEELPVQHNKVPSVDEHLSVMKRSQKKRSRVDAELIRLSCKIVNVEVEKEEDEEKKQCTKPFCQLGCVCKSLRCENTLIFHCQNEKCMFSCNCPKERQPTYEHRVTLPAGTNVLSSDTVTKIEDEAKKHLARVEREFTQTIIQTNNRTIVVGASGRSKTRRAAQLPKKYTDYVENIDEDDVTNKQVDFTKRCVVSLTSLNLDAVIPFCMQHNNYDCFCRGLSDYVPKDHPRVRTSLGANSPASAKKTAGSQIVDKAKARKRSNENVADHNLSEPVSKKRAVSDTDVTTKHTVDAAEDEPNAESSLSLSGETTAAAESDSPTSSRPVRNKKAKKSEFFEYSLDPDVETCARTMEVKRRRKSNTNVSIDNFESALRNDFVYNYTQADLLKIKMNHAQRKRHLEVDILKQTLLADHLASPVHQVPVSRHIVPAEPLFQRHLHNRKQTLEVRNDHGPSVKHTSTDPTILPLPPSIASAAFNQKKKSLTSKQPLPVFEGEIIINESSMDLLRKMGPRTVAEGYARLLPWRVLSDSFKNGTINIWCMVDQPSRLLVNKADKKAPKNYVDIKMARQPTEVIMWILRDKLPASYQEENVSFILRETKDNFEICGVCTKNLDAGRGGDVRQKEAAPRPAHALTDTGAAGGGASTWLEAGLTLKHRDMANRHQSLLVCIERHDPQTLGYENSIDHSKITAHLPQIGPHYKWRLIHLKSDFSCLYFLKSKYSVKYVDLMLGARMGGKSKDATVMLHSNQLKTVEDHPRMGIYFDQSLPNRMFVGPYSRPDSRENLAETMRYVNMKLVSTEAFHKMSGKDDYRSGFWMVESPAAAASLDMIVDLTADEPTTAVTPTPGADALFGESPSPRRPSSAQRSRTTSRTSVASMDDGTISPASDGFFGVAAAQVSLTHENAQIEIVEAPPRKPEEFNRFVITNIPHFGYLGAFKHPSSEKIDVSWPFENKLLRFPTVKVATEFLQERFSSLLLPVPETFKIHVIVVNHLDTHANLPIDANVLSGHYICGEFGYYSILTITPQTCLSKLKRTREELLKMFAKRCQVIVRKRSETLAALLHLGKPTNSEAVADVNEKAVEEINRHKMLERYLITQKKEQMVRKRLLVTKVVMLLRDLPEMLRAGYSKRLKKILVARQGSEPIEIGSDSEGEAVEEEEEEEEEDRGPPVLEAQPLTSFTPPTPPFDELPVLEKQVPTGTVPVVREKTSVIKPRPPKELLERTDPPAKFIPLPSKWHPPGTATTMVNPRSVLRTSPASLLRTSSPMAPPTALAPPTAQAPPTPRAAAPPLEASTSLKGNPAHDKYLKGIRVVKGPNGQFRIVPKKPAPPRFTKVWIGGSSAESDTPLVIRSREDSLATDSATVMYGCQ